MKRMKYSLIFFLFLLSMLVVPTITAQNATDEIQYKITGRMLMDGGRESVKRPIIENLQDDASEFWILETERSLTIFV